MGKLGTFAKCHLTEEELKRSQTAKFEEERNVKQNCHDEDKTGGCMILVERQDWLSHVYSDGGHVDVGRYLFTCCFRSFVFALKILKG